VRFTQIDYDREMALVAIDASGDQDEIRGMAQYNRLLGGVQAEFGIAVEDSWQGRGVGFALMEALESCGRARGIAEIFGYVLVDNDSMRRMMVARGYAPARDAEDPGILRFQLALNAPAEALVAG
jgi:acetyltransferase